MEQYKTDAEIYAVLEREIIDLAVSLRGFVSRSGPANAAFRYDPSCEKAILENPRLCSNESPSGAFKRQSGLR